MNLKGVRFPFSLSNLSTCKASRQILLCVDETCVAVEVDKQLLFKQRQKSMPFFYVIMVGLQKVSRERFLSAIFTPISRGLSEKGGGDHRSLVRMSFKNWLVRYKIKTVVIVLKIEFASTKWWVKTQILRSRPYKNKLRIPCRLKLTKTKTKQSYNLVQIGQHRVKTDRASGK